MEVQLEALSAHSTAPAALCTALKSQILSTTCMEKQPWVPDIPDSGCPLLCPGHIMGCSRNPPPAEDLAKNDSWKRWMRHQLFSGGGGCPCQLCQEFIQVLSGKCSCDQGSGLERQLRPAGVAEPFGKGSWYWAGQNPDVLMVPGVSFQCTGEIGDGTSPGRSREISLGTSQA